MEKVAVTIVSDMADSFLILQMSDYFNGSNIALGIGIPYIPYVFLVSGKHWSTHFLYGLAYFEHFI